MSLNWAMVGDDKRPVPLPHETTIMTIDNGVELSLVVPDAPPSSSDLSGGSGGDKKMKELGRLYLTDQRLIFVSSSPMKSALESVSIPLHHILTTKFEQPTFGSNYLKLDIKPSQGGGMTDGSRAEVRFKDRGMFEFTNVLEKTREKAMYMRRAQSLEEDALPTYSSPGERSDSSITILPTRAHAHEPSEAPPGYDA